MKRRIGIRRYGEAAGGGERDEGCGLEERSHERGEMLGAACYDTGPLPSKSYPPMGLLGAYARKAVTKPETGVRPGFPSTAADDGRCQVMPRPWRFILP